MVWQKVVTHVTDSCIKVESKSGNRYTTEPEKERYGKDLYTYLMNDAHDDKDVWAWVDFDNDNATLRDWTVGDMPDKPPWER